MLTLQEILFSQGFGTRRQVQGLIESGLLYLKQLPNQHWENKLRAKQLVDEQSARWKVGKNGDEWQFYRQLYLILNKPIGYECSHKPSNHPSVYSLLPLVFRQRPSKTKISGVQAVGRLDQDTTGLLLFTDDGQYLHKMTSPKKKVAKIYQVTTAEPVSLRQQQQLLAGVVLNDSSELVQAQQCRLISSRQIELSITQGKYHQVKRMLAAVGNRVVALQRSQIGEIKLPANLAVGQWCYLVDKF